MHVTEKLHGDVKRDETMMREGWEQEQEHAAAHVLRFAGRGGESLALA